MKSFILSVALFLALFCLFIPDSKALTYVIDFDSLAAGSDASTIATAYGDLRLSTNARRVVDFDSDFNPIYSEVLPLMVASGYQTTSGAHYLGLYGGDSPLLQQFAPGDAVSLDFSSLSKVVLGVSVNFIATANSPAGGFFVSSGNRTATSASPFTSFDPDLSDAFRVGLNLPTPSGAAVLGSTSDGLYSFSIDDITLTLRDGTQGGEPVPEPATLLLMALGGGCVYLVRRKQRRS